MIYKQQENKILFRTNNRYHVGIWEALAWPQASDCSKGLKERDLSMPIFLP